MTEMPAFIGRVAIVATVLLAGSAERIGAISGKDLIEKQGKSVIYNPCDDSPKPKGCDVAW